MNPEHIKELTSEIDQAHRLMETGHAELGTKRFDLARAMATAWANPKALTDVVQKEKSGLRRERDLYRKINFEHGAGTGRSPLLIIGDSLGLPRPNRAAGSYKGAEHTYPWMFGYEVHAYQPTSICQRYFTTSDALDALEDDASLSQQDAAIIHLGLNDCANRMFLEEERLALSLLDEALRSKIVGFAQKHRRAILRILPSRHYVSLDRFRHNLAVLCDKLKRGGCQKIILATIILPPARSWAATPGVNANFAAYNEAIMAAVAANGLLLLDLDHLVSKNIDEMLIEDGMHLSDAGHTLFTREAVKLLKS